ncbi:hypothetical protein CapIbe_004092, partial [Capra ibex]
MTQGAATQPVLRGAGKTPSTEHLRPQEEVLSEGLVHLSVDLQAAEGLEMGYCLQSQHVHTDIAIAASGSLEQKEIDLPNKRN